MIGDGDNADHACDSQGKGPSEGPDDSWPSAIRRALLVLVFGVGIPIIICDIVIAESSAVFPFASRAHHLFSVLVGSWFVLHLIISIVLVLSGRSALRLLWAPMRPGKMPLGLVIKAVVMYLLIGGYIACILVAWGLWEMGP